MKKKRGYTFRWPEYQRRYVSVRFMAGDGIEAIRTSNPWWTSGPIVEDVLRDQIQGERFGRPRL